MAARSHINQYQLARRAEVDEKIVIDIFDVILACMEEGVQVRLRGFGTFIPEVKAERMLKSPLVEGGQVLSPRHRTMRFRLSKSVKKQWTAKPKTEGGRE